jgi:hypothetical protein
MRALEHAGAVGRGLGRLAGLLAAAAAAGALVLAASAPAALAAGKPVNVGTPYENGQPAIAVTNSGAALEAWANTKDLNGASNFVQYCVLPVGASACSESGNLVPADSAGYIDNVQVLNEGSVLVVLADVYGAAGNNAEDYTPEQEWQSTDGGATWLNVNNGISVTSGIVDADTQPLSAVTLPGTGVLGYGWDTADGAPTFNAFPLSSPPECSVQTCPAGYATLEPGTNPDTLGNEPGQFAAQSGPQAGVMGVFETLFSNGPLGCAQSFGTGYVFGAGAQSTTNNYNISPGSPNSAWRVPLAQADCNVDYPAVAGGPSGFGILEDNEANGTVVYHRFDQNTEKFDTPLVTVAGGHGELDPALSQDSHGGIYATYLYGGGGGPINLSYSNTGGASWSTAALNADTDGGAGDVNSSVNATGQGWVTWTDNGSVFAQSFQAADAVTAPSVSSGASSNDQTVTVDVTCASFPCTVSITLTAPETVVLHAASVAHKKGKSKGAGKTLKLGEGKFTIKSAGAKKLTLNLSGSAKRLLKSKHGRIKIDAAITETVQGHSILLKKTLALTLKPAKKSKHHR